MKINAIFLTPFKATFLCLLLSSCAHKSHNFQLPQNFKHAEEKIQVRSAIQLAGNSYLLGCVQAHKELGKVHGANKKCKKWAQKDITENIIYIYNQDPNSMGKPSPLSPLKLNKNGKPIKQNN
jgi:hypothetical protein